MGEGDKIIAFDSHIDTVGIGNIDNWTDDPYQGYEDDAIIYGRGGSDQEGGMASATYGAKIMKDLGLIPEGYKIMVVGSVQERTATACAGSTSSTSSSPPREGEQVEFVISTEPTDGGIYRAPRPYGDPRGREGCLLPRLRSGAGRQRHLQDGRHPAGCAGPQREPRRR